MTVLPTDVTGGDVDLICGNDRTDVRTLKSIINVVANSNSVTIGVPVGSECCLTGQLTAHHYFSHRPCVTIEKNDILPSTPLKKQVSLCNYVPFILPYIGTSL